MPSHTPSDLPPDHPTQKLADAGFTTSSVLETQAPGPSGNTVVDFKVRAEQSQAKAGPDSTKPQADEAVESIWVGCNPDLTLLTSTAGKAPAFPGEVIGDFWWDWCSASARNANAPVDYTVGTLLATVGALLGNVRWPDVEGVWEHPSVLWVGLVGNPSTAKSPGMRPVRKLITHIENARANAVIDAGPQHRLKAFVAECAEREWRREIENTLANRASPPPKSNLGSKGKSLGEGPAAADAAEGPYAGLPVWPKEAQIPETPVQPVLHVVDATIEALITTSAGSPRGLLQFSDELSAWFGGFDRYRAKGVSADRPFWLKAFDGDPYSVLRKGGDLKNGVRAPIEIRHLSIGVIGSVQPDPLRRFLTNTDDGLAHRFLWMWPERSTTFKIPRKSETQLKADDEGALAAFIALDQLDAPDPETGKLPRPLGEPKRVSCSPAATDLLEAYGQSIMDRCENASAWYASTMNKASGLALRLSLVLTYLRWSVEADKPEPQEIDADNMQRAIRLMDEYFLPQAERVRDCASVGDAENDARALVALIRKLGLNRVTGRMIHRIASGRLADTRIRKAAFEVLVDAGLLREAFSRKGKTVGRQKELYVVHPSLLNTERAQVKQKGIAACDEKGAA